MEMTIYILAVLAIAPPLLIAVYIYDLNEKGQTDLRTCLKLMAYGALAVFPIVVVEGITVPLLADDGLFIQMVFGIALVEEGFKFFVIKRFVYEKGIFSAPIDGIVYAVMVGLGFALMENLRYVFQYGFLVGVTRMFTAVPMHAICGVLLGYFIGRARLEAAKEKQLIAGGIASAVLLHGIYNFTADLSVGLLPLFIVLGIGFYYANSMVRKGQTISMMIEKWTIPETKPVNPEETAKQSSKDPEATIEETEEEDPVLPEHYEQAYNELESGEAKSGIWAMAYANTPTEEEAKKRYINLRAEELLQAEELAKAEAVKLAKKERKRKADEADRLAKEEHKRKADEAQRRLKQHRIEVAKIPDLISWATRHSYIVESKPGSYRIRKEPFGKFESFSSDLDFLKHLTKLKEGSD